MPEFFKTEEGPDSYEMLGLWPRIGYRKLDEDLKKKEKEQWCPMCAAGVPEVER